MEDLIEKNTTKQNKENLIAWGMLAALFVYMLALNILMPLHRDDYEYALIWGTFEKIRAWPDVFQSLYNHYLTHGGRMVAFFVLDSFMIVGKEWFNPFNAFLYVMLMLLIYWHSERKITFFLNPYILGLIILFTWLGLPHFALVNIWMTGACVYLMTAVFILAFLLPYNCSFLGNPVLKNSNMAMIGMFLGGIIAGWTIENTAVTLNLIVISYALYAWKKQNLQKWMVSGVCGSLIGLFLLVVSPGNYVRYAGTNTKLIYHFTNQLAAGGEMLLYILPILLFFVVIWRSLLTQYGKQKGIYEAEVAEKDTNLPFSFLIITGIIFFMMFSYGNGNFFSKAFGNLLYNYVAIPLGVATNHLKVQLFNTVSGIEEMAIYLLTITQMYRYIFRKLALRAKDIKEVVARVSTIEVMNAYPVCYYVALMIGLAVVNNLVMIASPTFPGRATYGSVLFLIVGVMSFFTIPLVRSYWLENPRKKYIALFIGIIMVPMMAATLQEHRIMAQENNARMAYVEKMASQGAKKLEVEPLSLKNRILRHVYFVELNNGVSKYGLCRYYGLDDIKVPIRE